MAKKTFKGCVAVCFFMLLVLGCKRNDPDYFPVNEGLKKAFFFNVGTYWIYRDSITGDMDSFYVTGYKLHPRQEFTNGVRDILDMYVSSATFGYLFQFEYIQNVMSLGDPIDSYHFGINYPLDNTSLNPSLIHYPSYIINGHTYSNVFKLYATNVITNAYKEWYFFTYQIGIIKMTLTKAGDTSIRVWELQRYHIEQ